MNSRKMMRSTTQPQEDKPKMIFRNPNSITLSWENTFSIKDADLMFHLQILDDFKEWKTIYRGKNYEYKVLNLAPCTCYTLRIRSNKKDEEWINFKAATEDKGPYSSTMHMSRAVRLGKNPLIRKIAHNSPHLLNTENKENKTPLIQAIEMGDLHLVQLLITLGAKVNTSLHFNKKSPLMVAVFYGQIHIASILMDKGADKYATDINGLNILHYAVDSENVESVKFCLEHIEDVNCADQSGWTPLIRAGILKVSNEIVQLLLDRGADPNLKDKLGFSFLDHKKISDWSPSLKTLPKEYTKKNL